MKRLSILLFLWVNVVILSRAQAQYLDMRDAKIIVFENENRVEKAVTVLQEEIAKRTGITMPIRDRWPEQPTSVFVVGTEVALAQVPQPLHVQIRQLPDMQTEGFKLLVDASAAAALVIGHDTRGVLYGVGRLLRKMALDSNRVDVPTDLVLSTSPTYPLRGHQLGYRPKTNAYDAWSVEQFDLYIRELALFGANSIEIMPPHTDDDRTSRHMTLPAFEMMVEQSRICDSYDMDVWMWYPNMGSDYTHPDSLEKELQERREVFSALPRLDAVFVPGGDPGDLFPTILFDWLDQISIVLRKSHPNAKIWVSPQAFHPTREWMESFYDHINRGYSFVNGVVFGPWVKTPLEHMRMKVKHNLPIRRYPDITHSLSSQYPVPHWDLAYAMTLGRECINPRPRDQKIIHNALDEFAEGSISYSEGTNDDVNKFIWSDLDWNPDTPVLEILQDYARLFVGPNYEESMTLGLLALEENWRGPLLDNATVENTLRLWQAMEQDTPKAVLNNYRFQMGLLRAYYDAYVQQRLIYETALEIQAREILRETAATNSRASIIQAREILGQAWQKPVRPEWHERCFELANALFQSIGAQLTVEKHGAKSGRGNFLDSIEMPLNNAVWMLDQFERILEIESEDERLTAIAKMLNRTDPGSGGFHDNFGNPGSWEHVVQPFSWMQDPGGLMSPRVSFGVGLRSEEWVHEVKAHGFQGRATPLAWMNQVTTLFDTPLELVYDNLQRNIAYRLRVAYTGRFRSSIKLVAEDCFEIHDFIRTGEEPMYEFDIPPQATQDGRLELKWTCREGQRGSQVAELWLFPKP